MAECDTSRISREISCDQHVKDMDVDKAVTRAGAALGWETLKEK